MCKLYARTTHELMQSLCYCPNHLSMPMIIKHPLEWNGLKSNFVLAREDGWLEHCPVNQKVVGSIPGQGT